MDPWQRQRALSRTTLVWAALSSAAGLPLLRHRDPWWRGFGRQQVGWAAVDVGIVLGADALRRRRMRRLPNPYAPAALAAEARTLHRVLLANVVADAGYVAGGLALWRGRRDRPLASGAGAGIAVQGAFLLLHDAHHAYDGRRRRSRRR